VRFRRIIRRRAPLGATALGLSSALVAGLMLANAGLTSANATLKTFSAHGSYKWTVPSGVEHVIFDVYGASGGNIVRSIHGELTILAYGGAGGEARGRFKVVPGEVFEIKVGGAGLNDGTGGFNGGGYAQSTAQEGTAGGGGASDVRVGGTGNRCVATLECGEDDRIIVGGGGGGAAYANAEGDGLPGGGARGGDSDAPNSYGGRQEQRYSGDTCPSLYSLGCFGWAGGYDVSGSAAQAGGGSGWYGGDGSSARDVNKGGSGGSGYVSPLALSGSFPGGTRTGDGLVVIKSA
jgi:hypothetical protein